MKENPIVSKFQEKDLKKLVEDIKSGNIKPVYAFFNCKCKNEDNYPRRRVCGDCPYLYKEDIRVPNRFGCYVEDYIDMIEDQLSKE